MTDTTGDLGKRMTQEIGI